MSTYSTIGKYVYRDGLLVNISSTVAEARNLAERLALDTTANPAPITMNTLSHAQRIANDRNRTMKAKRGQRCIVYLGDGSTVSGVLAGYIKRNQGSWNASRYSIVALDDGSTFETILPIYVDDTA